MLTAPWEVLSGGLVVPFSKFSVLGDVVLDPTPAHAVDLIIAAHASDLNATARPFLYVLHPGGTLTQVSLAAPAPDATLLIAFRSPLERWLIIPAGYALGARADSGNEIELTGYLFRYSLK